MDALSEFEFPRILDLDYTADRVDDAAMGDYFDSHDRFRSPATVLGEEVSSGTSMQLGSPKPVFSRAPAPPAPETTRPRWSTSPASTSGSDLSNQHLRTNSSGSSHVGEHRRVNAAAAATGFSSGTEAIGEEEENRFMESTFDFDNAASSPTPEHRSVAQPIPATLPQINMTNMALRTQAPGEPRFGLRSRSLNGSPEACTSNLLATHEDGTWNPLGEPMPQTISPEHFQSNRALNTSGWSRSTGADLPSPSTAFEGLGSTFEANLEWPPFPMPTGLSAEIQLRDRRQGPTLHCGPLPLKSRVETQSNVKLTLDPLPDYVKKLHLQPYTISKAKLMSRPTPDPAPDTYELFTQLVCSSAMQHEEKLQRAFARAREMSAPYQNRDGRRSSADDASADAEDESKPLNGGPVQICPGCIERERKRAARKRTRNPEEEEAWLKDEAKRIVVFNTQEVKDWQLPSNTKTTEGNNRNMPPIMEPTLFSPQARQIDIPMRIACYCRHQEEKQGFRVIFTIRDHTMAFVAQAVSNSIMITDDHKTHPAPNPLPNTSLPVHPQMFYSPSSHYAGSGAYSQFSSSPNDLIPLSRTSQSTPDLQNLQQQYTHVEVNHLSGAFAPLAGPSQAAAAALNPKTLSRPASPSPPSELQQPKRRKGSGSKKIRNDLVMTKVSTDLDRSASRSATVSPETPSRDHQHATSAANLVSPSMFGRSVLPFRPATPHYRTNPTTPTEEAFFSNGVDYQRSQSLNNLQQGLNSAPPSVQQSRASSPPDHNTGQYVQSLGMNADNGMTVTNAVQHTTSPQIIPILVEIAPAQGPISGGIRVVCLGTGFRQGCQVLFGGSPAIDTRCLGDTTLTCWLPPVARSGLVEVTLMLPNGQVMPSPTNGKVYFTYVDSDEPEIMRRIINVLGQTNQSNGNVDVDKFYQYIRAFRGDSQPSNMPGGGPSNNHRQASSSNTKFTADEMEVALLRCLEILDLDDSPRKADLNQRGYTGQSMLHLCASLGYYRVAAGLLARGAHADLRDHSGMSPMHMASLHGHARIIRKLRAAGGDPTLRSLNGLTPSDMATTFDAQLAAHALDYRSGFRSGAATPLSGLSRSGSIASRTSSAGECLPHASGVTTNTEDAVLFNKSLALSSRWKSLSRRNSFGLVDREPFEHLRDGPTEDSALVTQSAFTAWRDQISAQLTQVQQTVHRALPPLPNLPDYQGNPVVRRISSLVPQRGAQSPSVGPEPEKARETDYHWWELLTGASSAPPAYEDIYPDKTKELPEKDGKSGLLQAAGEAILDSRCASLFDKAEQSCQLDTFNIGRDGVTQEQRDKLRAAHAHKVKRLRSDRNLFFIWIPLLVFVVFMMLKDRLPQLVSGILETYNYVQGRRSSGRVEEVL